jgi:hypothetical protein
MPEGQDRMLPHSTNRKRVPPENSIRDDKTRGAGAGGAHSLLTAGLLSEPTAISNSRRVIDYYPTILT